MFSLYGEVRRPTGQSMGTFDTILIDLQDLGCRIYTFITTLLYVLEAAAEHGKSVWVLDRPNPAGRPVEGLTLRPGWESFVGAGPMPMRHGLTLGELGRWFVDHFKLDVDYRVIEMEGWQPGRGAGLRLAARAGLDQPEPQCRQPQHGARLCRHGDARRHDAERGQGHDPRRSSCSARPTSSRARSWPRWSGSRPNGSPAASCATSRSSRPSTSMSASCAAASSSTPKGRSTTMQAFKPWRLQALAFKAIRRLYPDYDAVARLPVRI